ncbi:cardiolipin synthase [Desulfatitalea tepidiphila]|uniref:cardiolipin synthase n=1 Tax=Desulfatitalea tepidiphila TaxID=1185843 RepID=UPI0006B62E1D|nr:cardiolipin synthase [Desulfatitalea tepidiphila]
MFGDVSIFSVMTVVILVFEIAGLCAAVHAIATARTSQSAIAWAIALVTFPWITLILYAILGRNKFNGYVTLRHAKSGATAHLSDRLFQEASQKDVIPAELTASQETLVRLAQTPVTRYNQCRLLSDGGRAFARIFASIDHAAAFVLVQFYIVRDDRLGRDLKTRLIDKARSGVKVYFLYDEIGSYDLPQNYLIELRRAGVAVSAFHSTRGKANRFQLNFRNHRKIVIVDGVVGYVGGNNVGDEYVSAQGKWGAWRDTHVEVHGPAILALQFAFAEDWCWATGAMPELNWQVQPTDGGNQEVLVLPSGPADQLETCGLMFVRAINDARWRLWMATPYFIPDEKVLAALKLAALRGVDIRIILPERPDHRMMHLASFAYYEKLLPLGIRIYRYTQGFMHQKVFVVDDTYAAIGTANLDNRSFRLNFEVTLINFHPAFVGEVEEMLMADIVHSRMVTMRAFERRSVFFKFAVKAVSLLEPIL